MFKKRRPTGVLSHSKSDSAAQSEPDARDDSESLSETLEELIALRKLKRTTGGIDLERLNAGEKKKRKLVKQQDDGEPAARTDGMVEGTVGGLNARGRDRVRDEPDDDPDDADAKTRRSVRSNNFTGQTNAVDVDKHMMAYIEEELRKRKGPNEHVDVEEQVASLDPRDALYQVADKYRIDKKQVEEGNVTLSAAMLTAIPEVDLGIDARLRNIEETEKAKRALLDAKAKVNDEEHFAADRFYRTRRPLESDSDALAKARKEAAGLKEEPRKPLVGQGRREMATDDQVMDRFKKRQQGRK